jgi:putative spermidine/putrescine transport system substrate-binding protein/spermidine/putrescine transport system substrate-binding protein
MTKSHKITRRQFGIGAAAAAGALTMAPRLARAAKELRILTWEGYADDTWLKPFETATGAKCSASYVGSVDEMFAKMQGSKGADYDVVAFDTSSFKRYMEQNLIQPIDLSKIPNSANLQPAFQNVEPTMKDGKHYGIPFAWGSLPLVYDKKAFPDGAPDSWAVMWDPQYAQQMIALDDANNSITNAAILLGLKDPFNLSDAEFEQVKAKLIEQKKLLLTYYAGFDEGVNIFASSGIKLMFSMGEPQVPSLIKKGVDAALTIPKEGAIGWLDCWTISAGAQDLDLAQAWINACLDKSVGQYLSAKEGYGNTTNEEENKKAGLTYADKLLFLKAPEDFQKRVAVWNEVKAAPVQ